MSTEPQVAQQSPRAARAARTGASPAAAAAFAAGLVYVWGEAAFRLLFTYFPGFDARWVLWNGRVGDIAAMWLTISGVAAVAGVALRRGRIGRAATRPMLGYR